jgi:Fungal specific transcription factor domain
VTYQASTVHVSSAALGITHAMAFNMRCLLEFQTDTTAFTMNSVAVNPEGSWLSFALTDAALLHATLSLVAYHYDITHGKEESLDSLCQKVEAIKKMNRRLSDSHQQFSDTTIATVSLFANIEVYSVSTQGLYGVLTEEKTMSGIRPISDVHITALVSMVNARGGLENFNHNKVLQRVLTW